MSQLAQTKKLTLCAAVIGWHSWHKQKYNTSKINEEYITYILVEIVTAGTDKNEILYTSVMVVVAGTSTNIALVRSIKNM